MLDGAKILRETWKDNTLVPLYDNEDSVCGIEYNGAAYYFLKNQQGDVIAITDSSGNEVARYSYDAWGKVRSVKNSNNDEITNESHIAIINPFRYRGYYFDQGTNLYYLQSRYYDADVGRFINGDEVIYLGTGSSICTYNLFHYCENEPIFNCDFSGYASAKIYASGSFDKKYENQISNSKLYKKNKSVFFFKNKKNAERMTSRKFDGGFLYRYGFYSEGGFLTQKGFRYSTYYFLTKKVSQWKKLITSCDFSWITDVINIAAIAMQLYSSTAYCQNPYFWEQAGDTLDRTNGVLGPEVSQRLKKVVIDPMSRYISGKISGKKKSEKVSILIFAKTTVNLKKIFSKKWYTHDILYGYPWEKNYYCY